MKHMNKIFALVLALVMILGLASFASADENDSTESTLQDFSISIKAPDNASLTGRTYAVYQIFTGKLEEEGGKQILSDVKYGANYGTEGEDVPEDLLTNLNAMSGEAAAAYLNVSKTGTAIANLTSENNWSVDGLPAGYYLVVDVTANIPTGETASAFILQLLDNVEIKSKHTAGPTNEKKIDDTNDSVDATNDIIWHDSADHDIGDLIDFQITTTLPAAFQLFVDNNKAYPYTLHDTEEAGLTFQPDSVTIKIGEYILVKGTDYTLNYPAADGHTFDIVFTDLTKVTNAAAGAQIVVNYKSMLNENAILGSQGNVNQVFGEFRNFYDDDQPGFTPIDTVIAFTYKVVVNKVDENNVPLSGAKFTLEKFVANAEGTENYKGIQGNWVAKATVETEPDTVFTFKGLDDGYYRLTETEAPVGYNSIAPIEFTVTADHDILWETQERTDVLNTLTGDVETGVIEFSADATSGLVSTNIVNKSGTVLPETGGIGTTIFYIVGGVLAVAAIVLLITKKRMSVAE